VLNREYTVIYGIHNIFVSPDTTPKLSCRVVGSYSRCRKNVTTLWRRCYEVRRGPPPPTVCPSSRWTVGYQSMSDTSTVRLLPYSCRYSHPWKTKTCIIGN